MPVHACYNICVTYALKSIAVLLAASVPNATAQSSAAPSSAAPTPQYTQAPTPLPSAENIAGGNTTGGVVWSAEYEGGVGEAVGLGVLGGLIALLGIFVIWRFRTEQLYKHPIDGDEGVSVAQAQVTKKFKSVIKRTGSRRDTELVGGDEYIDYQVWYQFQGRRGVPPTTAFSLTMAHGYLEGLDDGRSDGQEVFDALQPPCVAQVRYMQEDPMVHIFQIDADSRPPEIGSCCAKFGMSFGGILAFLGFLIGIVYNYRTDVITTILGAGTFLVLTVVPSFLVKSTGFTCEHENYSDTWDYQDNRIGSVQERPPAIASLVDIPEHQLQEVDQPVPNPAAAAAPPVCMAPSTTLMQVNCPQGAAPGSTLSIMTPAGQQMQVQVPPGVGPGQAFQISVPAPVVAAPQPIAVPVPTVMQITCPPGSGPGASVSISTPGGQQFMVQVPPGVGPGQAFQVQVPIA